MCEETNPFLKHPVEDERMGKTQGEAFYDAGMPEATESALSQNEYASAPITWLAESSISLITCAMQKLYLKMTRKASRSKSAKKRSPRTKGNMGGGIQMSDKSYPSSYISTKQHF